LRAATAFAVAILYGLSDEWHQSFVPGRTPDVWDLVVDAIGALTGIGIAIGVARHLERRRSLGQTSGNPSSVGSP
jgi:VanZ family protein